MTDAAAKPVAKRAYNSSRRAQQAAQTRSDVLAAAVELFRSRGWGGTTLAAIAELAGVAVETVYKGFGSKKALLRAAIDVAIAGDAEPIPFVDRPEFASFGEGSMDQRIARGATVTAAIHERSAGVWQAITEAASSDEEVEGWRLELEQGRRIDVGRSVERIIGRELDDDVVTLLWVLYGPDTYRLLTGDAGWSRADYEAFLVRSSQRVLATVT
jgi:AcrR family transcriptional regulator